MTTSQMLEESQTQIFDSIVFILEERPLTAMEGNTSNLLLVRWCL